MMQTPPIPPGFTTTPPQAGGLPPIPPGFSTQPPTPVRPAAPQVQQAPASGMTDLGISADEEITALVRQGYTMEQARAMAAQPEAPGGYRVVASEDLAPEDTPNSLSAQGYAYDGSRGVWAQTVGTEQIQPPPSVEGPGYLLARQQEEEKRAWRPNTMLPDWMERGYGQLDFTSQLTAPFNDEVAGGLGYLQQGAANLGRRIMGRDIEVSATDRARAMTDLARRDQETFQREHPIQTTAGSLLGGFAVGPARAMGPLAFARPTVAQGYGQAAAVSAGYGAADAQGGFSGRLQGAGTGAVLGVATAGVLDSALGGVSALRNMGRTDSADARVGQVLDRAIRRDNMAPQDVLSQLPGRMDGQLPLDMGGGNLSGIAEVVAQTPGPARTRIMDALTQRNAMAGDRTQSRIGEGLGGKGDYFATLDNQIAQRRQAANDVMSQIEGRTFQLSPNAVQALRSDIAQQQIRNAARFGLASADEATRTNAANLNRLADTLLDNPSAAQLDLRTAQDVSKSLLDASSAAWRNGDGAAARAYGDLGRAVRENAREAVPEYRQWLQRYGDESDQIEALELGRKVFNRSDDTSAERLRQSVSGMDPTSRDLFRKGVGEALLDRARGSRGGVGAMRDLVRSQEFGDRVRVAFPDEQSFTRFLNAAEAEVQMANTGNRILEGSQTAFRQNAARDLGNANIEQGANTLSNASLVGLPLELGRQGIRAAGRLIGRNRGVLTNQRLNDLLGEALTDPATFQRLLSLPPRRGLFGGRAPAGVAGAIPQTVF